MGIKAILKNVKNVGITGTYEIYKERKEQRQAEELEEKKRQQRKATNQKVIGELKKLLSELVKIEKDEEKAALMAKGIEAKDNKEVRNIFRQLDQKADKAYEEKMQSVYIKTILPMIYNEFCCFPVKKVVLFMQPRRGLNQSCRYIFRKLKAEGKYKVVLRELHRGEAGVSKYYANAEKFVRQMATAKGVFVHESNNLMGYLDIRKETKVIQLWHGCGVFKKIGLSTSGKEHFKSREKYEEYPEYNNYSIVTIASPELSWVFEEFMGIDKEEGIIQPIGVSRTDEFFDEEYVKNCYDTLHEVIPVSKEKKVILYAPTYRGIDPNRVSPDQLDVKMFAEALGDEYILIFKHHQTAVQVPEIPEPYRDKFAYDMTRGKGMSINDLMTVADICISDYSSLVFEYALFERPMLFYVYDLEDYIDERGLYYDFDEITPGPLCKTNEEMIDHILHIEERFNKQEVTDFKNRFMCCCDGHATERILEFMEK